MSACTVTWRETMSSRCNSQDQRLLKLEHSLLGVNTTIQGSHSFFLGLQAECKRIATQVNQYETVIPSLLHEIETTSRRVKSVASTV